MRKLNRTIKQVKALFALVAISSLVLLASTLPAYVNVIISIFAFIVWCIWMNITSNQASKTYVNERGYVVLVKENELAHRYIAKQLLNRDLKPNEVVHHINGRRTDNSIINLCLMDSHKHELFHSWLSWKRTKTGRYPHPKHQRQILTNDYDGILLEQIFSEKSRVIEKPTELSNNHNEEIVTTDSPTDAYDSNLLFEELRKERLRIAREENNPAYMIFYDKTLHRMAQVMPDNDALMLKTIGPRKYQKYGPAFIAVIKKFKVNNVDHKKSVIG